MQSRFLHIDDAKTWDAFRQGNQAAFAYIFQSYFSKLYNYGKKFTKDEAVIADTLQQLFVDLWQKKKSLSATDQIGFYLYKSFRRALLRNLKKQTFATLSTNFETTLSREAQLIEEQLNAEQNTALKKALDQLSDLQREIIYLKFYNNLSYPEIGEVMEMSTTRVYDCVYKALHSLRHKINEPKTGLGISSAISLLVMISHIAI